MTAALAAPMTFSTVFHELAADPDLRLELRGDGGLSW